jgi:hypothetical protein
MSDPKQLQTVVDRLTAGGLVQQAQIEVLLSLCRSLGARMGITEMDGLPIIDWFQRKSSLKVKLCSLSPRTKTWELPHSFRVLWMSLGSVLERSHRRMSERVFTPEIVSPTNRVAHCGTDSDGYGDCASRSTVAVTWDVMPLAGSSLDTASRSR